MTVETILREIEQRLGKLDEKAKEAVKLALKLAQGEILPKPAEPQWQGENPPFDEMAKLDIEERSRIMNELEEHNLEWLMRRCEDLGAMWLLVIDGQIYAHGKNLADNPPTDEEILELAQRTGKFPLFFLHPSLLRVEEVRWHPFVAVNPSRTALVGRDICLKLQPQVTLNFATQQTCLSF